MLVFGGIPNLGVAPFSNKTSVKTPSCCRIPQRTCQDLGNPGKLSSQDIATGIQQHGIHTHMQTQNLWDKKLVEKREPNFCTSFTEELLLKYENLDLEITVGFHFGAFSKALHPIHPTRL